MWAGVPTALPGRYPGAWLPEALALEDQDCILALMLLSCVTLGKLLGLSGLQFPCGQNGVVAVPTS